MKASKSCRESQNNKVIMNPLKNKSFIKIHDSSTFEGDVEVIRRTDPTPAPSDSDDEHPRTRCPNIRARKCIIIYAFLVGTMLFAALSILIASIFSSNLPSNNFSSFLVQFKQSLAILTTEQPSSSPSLYHTVAPSFKPSTRRSTKPTFRPSAYPTTSNPTSHPSKQPTSHPSYLPTDHPTQQPTDFPTASPTTPQPTMQPTPVFMQQARTQLQPPAVAEEPGEVIFYALGDIPYNESQESQLLYQLQTLPRDGEFIVHVGDIMKATRHLCHASQYELVDNILLQSPLPLFIIPGDNEHMDCPDQSIAWDFWMQHFLSL